MQNRGAKSFAAKRKDLQGLARAAMVECQWNGTARAYSDDLYSQHAHSKMKESRENHLTLRGTKVYDLGIGITILHRSVDESCHS